MSNNYTVYKHTSPSEKVYIGITGKSPEERWKNGHGYRNQTHFYRAIQKYGWENFKHEILHENLSKDEAKVKEIELIAAYRSADKNFGYNVTLGGEGGNGYNPPDYVRQKISEANRGKVRSLETRERIAQSKRGVPLSEETRRKLSEAHADIRGERNPMYGKHHTEETKKKMSEVRRERYAERISLNPKPVVEKPTPEELKQIRSERMRGENNPQYGRGLSVIQMTLNGDVIATYDTIREAERKTGVDHTVISRCCKGKSKTAGGFKWKYQVVMKDV